MTLSAHGFTIESRGLSAESLAKVDAFKQLLRQTRAWDDALFDDHDCARFLKARNWDLQAAKQMWDAMLAWRGEHRVDTIHKWFDFHERQEYDRVFPTGLHKTDKEGRPVLIQQLGRVNIGALYKVTTDDRIRLAHIAENEHLRRAVFPACSRAAGRPIDQLFTIIDLEGVAFTSMMRTTSLLKMFMAMDSNNYPETLARMAIINAPGWFSTSWSAVKSVLSGDTVRKIQILGKDYHAALLQHIPRENLLKEYGGTSSGRITDNIGPWQEPLLPPPVELLPEPPAPRPEGEELDVDVPGRRPASPVRPGAMGPGAHPAPPGSPPSAKRVHVLEPLLPEPQLLAGHGPPEPTVRGGVVGSPTHSVCHSDAASDTVQSMAAPLLSNFLPASDSPLAEKPLSQPLLVQAPAQPTGPSLASPRAQAATSSVGLVSGLAAGLVAGIQAAASHVGYNVHHAQPASSQGVTNGGVLHPPPSPGGGQHGSPTSQGITLQPHPRTSAFQGPLPQAQLQQLQSATPTLSPAGAVGRPGATGGPAQLQLVSPREEAAGPGTYISTTSMVYSPLSAFSPMSQADPHAAADTATSRLMDAAGAGSGRMGAPGGCGPGRLSGGGAGMGSGPLGSALGGGGTSGFGLFGSAMLAVSSSELVSSAAGPALQQQQSSQQQSQQDNDDAESVRMSVMSQRSFYSALSHVEYSSSSGLTSPNEASDRARRWSLQRELHAAAIASALAATAERRAAAGMGMVSPSPSVTSKATGGGPAVATGQSAGGAPPAPMTAALPGVPSFLPPAAQQAFGSYLDQPPPYGAHGAVNGSGHAGAADGSAADGADQSGVGGQGRTHGVQAPGDDVAVARRGGHSRSASHVEVASLAGDAVIVVGSDGGGSGGGGLSRSNSAAAMDECNLGVGAVRWARGWFFRRRNYGRLIESDSAGHVGAGGRGGIAGGEGGKSSSAGMHGRKGSSGGPYASMLDGPDGACATSPSKTLPKGAVHHARGDSWDWDQPSPYDHDQTSRGPGAHREAPFGRGGERRRLLRSESPGHRRGLLDGCCACLPGCTVM